ncbi:MAG: radical SAM protein, partial [Candidatus Aenigmatarchaeota archaeon]
MNILIIRPYHRDSKRVMIPPRGMALIASYLRKEHGVKLIDRQIECKTLKELKENIKDFSPELIGFYLGNVSGIHVRSAIRYQRSIKLLKFISSFSHAKTFVTGNLTGLIPENIINSGFDFAIHGEWEKIIRNLADTIESGGNIKNVKGIYHKKNEEVKYTGKSEYFESLDELGLPAYDLLNMDEYKKRCPYPAEMVTRRGCPYNCIYCVSKKNDHIREMSIEQVIKELKYIKIILTLIVIIFL